MPRNAAWRAAFGPSMQQTGNSRTWVAAMRALDFPAALRVCDDVLAARDPAARDDPGLPYHLRWVWDGTPPDERQVMVRCYHGLGDTIQFARLLPALAARAAGVTVEVPPALLPIATAWPVALAPFDPAHPLPRSDCDIELMELPHALRTEPWSLDGDWLGGWRGGGGIAMCGRAGDWDPDRSIPHHLLAAALPPSCMELHQPGAGVPATVAALRAADRVITVDTFVAHLAGAIGAPTLLLLKHDPDWRWQYGEGASAWYPSVAMVRQHAPGDWSEPLRAAAEASRR